VCVCVRARVHAYVVIMIKNYEDFLQTSFYVSLNNNDLYKSQSLVNRG
jgi:hypothetical protein